jgi:tetratricopeptide (TPR) repeat protein
VGFYSLFWILNWLIGSRLGQLILVVAALWYLDDRYLGLLAGLLAPIRRSQRIAAHRRTVEINPADVRTMVELGDIFMHSGKYNLAAEYLEKAADRGEDSPRALYLLGGAWVKLGRGREGRAKLEAALQAAPTVAYGEPYLYLLEEAFAAEGPNAARVAELVAHFEEFDSVEVLTRAGRLCADAGRKDLARELFADAVRNYGFIPRRMRRRARRWLVRAQLGLLKVK